MNINNQHESFAERVHDVGDTIAPAWKRVSTGEARWSVSAVALLAIGETPPAKETDPALLATWTMVCNQMMNLDEALNK